MRNGVLRVGVDATCWHNRRGYGRHARALLRALVRQDSAARYTLVADSPGAAEPFPEGAEVQVVPNTVPTVEAASAKGSRSLGDMWRMSRALSSAAFDVLLFPTIYSFVPVFTPARKVVMLHDVIAETYPGLTVPRSAARLFWNAKVAAGRAQADALVTVSEYSRAQIVRHFGLDPARVTVVGEAADPVFRRLDRPEPGETLTRLGIDGSRPIVVYLGGFSPHKNLEALVAAFARLASKKEFARVLLVMAGDTTGDAFHTYFQTISAQVGALGLQERAIFSGYMGDDDLVVLLNLASVLVLPSLMEGFGLPAIEAAASGCPVIATKASPLPELLGEGGIYTDSCVDGIAAALETVLSSPDLQARMRRHGLAAAQRLTWDAAARQMINVIHDFGRA